MWELFNSCLSSQTILIDHLTVKHKLVSRNKYKSSSAALILYFSELLLWVILFFFSFSISFYHSLKVRKIRWFSHSSLNTIPFEKADWISLTVRLAYFHSQESSFTSINLYFETWSVNFYFQINVFAERTHNRKIFLAVLIRNFCSCSKFLLYFFLPEKTLTNAIAIFPAATRDFDCATSSPEDRSDSHQGTTLFSGNTLCGHCVYASASSWMDCCLPSIPSDCTHARYGPRG